MDGVTPQIENQPEVAAPEITPADAPSAAPEQRVNVWNPDGELRSLPAADAQEGVDSGNYSFATPEESEKFHLNERRGTYGQKLLTRVEGIGNIFTAGAFPALEKWTGLTTGQDILERRENNPSDLYGGETYAALAAPAITALGAPLGFLGAMAPAAALESGAGAAASGLLGGGTAGAIGSTVTRMAIGNGLMAAADEVSKMTADGHAPSMDAVETAAANVGLAAAIGGGIGLPVGAAAPLWKATMGPKVTQALSTLSRRMGGSPAALAEPATQALEQAGVEIPPEVKAGLSSDPDIQRSFQYLQESQTKSGEEAQQSFKDFKKSMGDNIATSLGKSPEEIQPLHEISKAEKGQELGSTLAKQVDDIYQPIGKQFEDLKDRFKNVELPKSVEIDDPANPYVKKTVIGSASELTDQLLGMASSEGWDKLPDSRFMNVVKSAISELPSQETLKDLNALASAIGKSTYSPLDPEITRVGQMVSSALSDHATDVAIRRLGMEAPELVGQFKMARQQYSELGKLVRSLDGALHTGSSNPSNFIKFLKNMSNEKGEQVLSRLLSNKNAYVLNLLKEQFPETASLLRSYHTNALLGASLENGLTKEINTNKFFRNLNKLSPELRNFVVPAESSAKLEAIDKIMNSFPDRLNPSGTAGTLGKILDKMPASVGGVAGLLLNKFPGGGYANAALGAALGHISKLLGREAPDAMRLGMLRFLMSDQPINSAGMKAAVDFIHQVQKGNRALDSAVKSIFDSSKGISAALVSQRPESLEKLDEMLKKKQNEVEHMGNIGSDLAHYMPHHGSSLSQFGNRAVAYLNQARPQQNKAAPLDNEPQVAKPQQKAFERQLEIANQPLSAMKFLKEGTLTAQDVQTIRSVYPSLYNRMSHKINDEMVSAMSEGKQIPYHTRLGLALFLATPLDSTMTPMGIQMLQAANKINVAPSQQNAPLRPSKSSPALGKMADSSMTSEQRAESRHLK